MTVTSRSSPDRLTVSTTDSPGALVRMVAARSIIDDTCWPSTATTTSDSVSPASAAGEPGETTVIAAPVRAPEASTPSTPRNPASVGSPATMRSATERAMSMGIAKPTPRLPVELPPPVTIESLMPITRPCRSASAPPELPVLIGASVWMAGITPPGVWTDRPTALTMPEVTVWSKPNGLPIATASWPTWTGTPVASTATGRPS